MNTLKLRLSIILLAILCMLGLNPAFAKQQQTQSIQLMFVLSPLKMDLIKHKNQYQLRLTLSPGEKSIYMGNSIGTSKSASGSMGAYHVLSDWSKLRYTEVTTYPKTGILLYANASRASNPNKQHFVAISLSPPKQVSKNTWILNIRALPNNPALKPIGNLPHASLLIQQIWKRPDCSPCKKGKCEKRLHAWCHWWKNR